MIRRGARVRLSSPSALARIPIGLRVSSGGTPLFFADDGPPKAANTALRTHASRLLSCHRVRFDDSGRSMDDIETIAASVFYSARDGRLKRLQVSATSGSGSRRVFSPAVRRYSATFRVESPTVSCPSDVRPVLVWCPSVDGHRYRRPACRLARGIRAVQCTIRNSRCGPRVTVLAGQWSPHRWP